MKRGKLSAPGKSANPEVNREPTGGPTGSTVDAPRNVRLDVSLDARLNASLDARLNASLDARLDASLDALYAAPFDAFVALRAELMRGLRAGGDPAGARSLAAAAKPTRTAWALNQVTRRAPAAMGAIVDAWKTASNAPLRREGVDLVDAARRYREAVAEVVREARSALEPDGVSLSPSQARRMAATLQALVRDETTRAELLRGRLTRDVTVEDPFAGLDADTIEGREAEPLEAEPLEAEPLEAEGIDAAGSEAGGQHAVGNGRKNRDRAEHERLERERAANQRAERERAERERAANQHAERERAERERAANQRAEREREERAAKLRAKDALRAKIASVEAAAGEARRRVQDAHTALARAQDEARRAERAALPYEAELASLRSEWEKLVR
jgi:hypothetical protein